MTDITPGAVARIAALAEGAHIERRYGPTGDTVPTIDEMEALQAKVERLSGDGSPWEAFVDAQSELINALLVSLEHVWGGGG